MEKRGTGNRAEHAGATEKPSMGHHHSPVSVSPRRQVHRPGEKHAVSPGQSPVSLTFSYPCMAAPRPRMLKGGQVYMPKRYQRWKERVGWDWINLYGRNPLGDNLTVEITLYSHNPPVGDLDNYAKSVLDALQGLAFDDDKARFVRTLSVTWEEPPQGFSGPGFRVSVSREPRR